MIFNVIHNEHFVLFDILYILVTYISMNIATPCSWLSSFFTGEIFSGPNVRDRLSYHGGILNGLNIRDRLSRETKNLRDI